MNVVDSCLQDKAQGHVGIMEIPIHAIFHENEYKPGYAAIYVDFNGKQVGFASSGSRGAIVFDGQLWLTEHAITLSGAEIIKKPEVRVELADWSVLDEGENQYLCVSDNFDGLGRSGHFQKIRYVYILQTRNGHGLFFSVGTIR